MRMKPLLPVSSAIRVFFSLTTKRIARMFCARKNLISPVNTKSLLVIRKLKNPSPQPVPEYDPSPPQSAQDQSPL